MQEGGVEHLSRKKDRKRKGKSHPQNRSLKGDDGQPLKKEKSGIKKAKLLEKGTKGRGVAWEKFEKKHPSLSSRKE